MADANRQGWLAGRDHVGLRRGPGPLYVANSDVRFLDHGARRLDPNAGGGLFALDLASGKISMQVPPVSCGSRSQCSPALSAAVTAIPGVVFSGAMSGYLRAYAMSEDDSEVPKRGTARRLVSTILSPGHAQLLWAVDTARDYATVNGRCDGGTRPSYRGRHALREFRLRAMGRSARQCPAGLRGQKSLTTQSPLHLPDSVCAIV